MIAIARQAATISIVKILFVLWTIFFAGAADAALHSAWIDAYTMFHVNDNEREKKKDWNEFVRFISCNSFIKQQNQQIHSQYTSKIIFDCVFDFRAK